MAHTTTLTKYNHQTMLTRLREATYTPVAELAATIWKTAEPVPFAQRFRGAEQTLHPGERWGDLFDCAWFHFTGVVPAEAAGQPVVLLIDINGEACVVDADGTPVQGLTNISSSFDPSLGGPGKRVVPFADCAAGGEVVDLWADAGCNDLFGRVQENGTFKEAKIAIFHPDVFALYYDVEVLADLVQHLPAESARRQQLHQALHEAYLLLGAMTPETVARARARLAGELAKTDGDPALTISAVGHAHIDLGWLWPIRETFRKGARTFSTALRMLERYPDYVFGASQPQLFQWMKDQYPALYAQIKARVAEGRWEAQGAMWVEADTNVSGGEALVRQLLYGKRFFRDEFDKEMRVLWLPDVFGYTGSLPQLLKQAGVDYFMTQKLSWSQVNTFPFHTFWWQGIDGSRVLAHMPPEGTYNSPALPHAVTTIEQGYKEKALSDGALMLFGIGDGGGGPGEEHLERLQRLRHLQGIAPVRQEPAIDFFERLGGGAARYPTWVGELYLERHQGTYTTQGRNKRYNRQMELTLRTAEWLAAQAHWQTGHAYPRPALEQIWKEVLLYQFHDILPGSSITRVYTESLARYALLLQETEALATQAAVSLYQAVDTAGVAQPAVVANALSWERTEYVPVADRWLKVTVPSLGYTVVDAAQAAEFSAPTATVDRLENELLCVRFHADGTLASVYDKRLQREMLAPGEAGNQLFLFHDAGDAWDFPMDYDQQQPAQAVLQSSAARVEGPQAIMQQVYRAGASTITQEVVLTAGSARLDFRTTVDWQENNTMLRAAFPVAVYASEVTCEIQYGSLRRPTHTNTSWDYAMYEVCAQKWVDLSDRGMGVALLNDGKYGHQVRGHCISLNLLRSPGTPDPLADRAEHVFTYALFPHAGDHVAGGVIEAGYALNVPLTVTPVTAHAGSLPSSGSLLSIDSPGIICEAVKQAEEGDDLIVRLYEAYGATTRAAVRFGLPVSAVATVNLLEEQAQPLPLADGQVRLEFRPFEIKTLRVSR